MLADLNRCRQEFETTGSISQFMLGEHDHSRRVVFISKMVGRESETELIKQQYNDVLHGKFRSLFISGLSGIGKTRLIQELQKPPTQWMP